jgi:hypothetical protein
MDLPRQPCRVAATNLLTRCDGKGATMHEQHFDALTKTLGNESSSRRRALQVVGAALASAGVLAHGSEEARAGKAQRRCRNKGGVYLPEGECHCSTTRTHVFDLPPCNGDASCRCIQTAGGRGLCALVPLFSTAPDCICNGCPANQRCVVIPEFLNSGRMCETTQECVTLLGNGFGCVNGRCEFTTCWEPCPTQP